jgi:hypothetical protein
MTEIGVLDKRKVYLEDNPDTPEDVAALISKGNCRPGMTVKQCEAARRTRFVLVSRNSYGEEFYRDGGTYLVFRGGQLARWSQYP